MKAAPSGYLAKRKSQMFSLLFDGCYNHRARIRDEAKALAGNTCGLSDHDGPAIDHARTTERSSTRTLDM